MMATLLWPSISDTTLGCTPAVNISAGTVVRTRPRDRGHLDLAPGWQDGRRYFRPETMALIDGAAEREEVSQALLIAS